MQPWSPSADQSRQYETDGYFIVRKVIDRDAAMEIRGVIRNHILNPIQDAKGHEHDPMDPMGDSPQAQAARFRKLGNYCVQSPVIWHTIDCGEPLLRIVRYFLGDDVLMKYNSCFLKPALTGSITPWHQDNGLWRDGETEPFNFWMAIDPATRENGCLQFIPGSHHGPIVPHVIYADSVHAELPRDHMADMLRRHEVHHIELAPGDIVCWHSSLYHLSPKNTSSRSRIAVAGVYSTPTIAARRPFSQQYQWCMKDGRRLDAFPPVCETFGDPAGQAPPHARMDEVSLQAQAPTSAPAY